MPAITLIHKITNAVLKLGTTNGTKIVQPEYDGEDKSNSAREQWFEEWQALAEYMIAATAASAAEGRKEKAKAKIETVFGKMLKDLFIGNKNMVQRANVGALFERRNAPRRINKQSVINVLSTAPYNWKLDDINTFLSSIETASPNGALYITPSTTME